MLFKFKNDITLPRGILVKSPHFFCGEKHILFLHFKGFQISNDIITFTAVAFKDLLRFSYFLSSNEEFFIFQVVYENIFTAFS